MLPICCIAVTYMLHIIAGRVYVTCMWHICRFVKGALHSGGSRNISSQFIEQKPINKSSMRDKCSGTLSYSQPH